METSEEQVDLVTVLQCLLAQACEYCSITLTTVLLVTLLILICVITVNVVINNVSHAGLGADSCFIFCLKQAALAHSPLKPHPLKFNFRWLDNFIKHAEGQQLVIMSSTSSTFWLRNSKKKSKIHKNMIGNKIFSDAILNFRSTATKFTAWHLCSVIIMLITCVLWETLDFKHSSCYRCV